MNNPTLTDVILDNDYDPAAVVATLNNLADMFEQNVAAVNKDDEWSTTYKHTLQCVVYWLRAQKHNISNEDCHPMNATRQDTPQ